MVISLCLYGCSKKYSCYGESTTFFFLYNNDSIRTTATNITQTQAEDLIKMYEQNGHTFISKEKRESFIEIDFSPNAYEKEGYRCTQIKNF